MNVETFWRGWLGEPGLVEPLVDLKFESAWTTVPGTMLICSSRARDWYFCIQVSQSKAWVVSALESATQPVR